MAARRRRGDFAFGKGAAFAWQHDARRRPDGTITLFDNHIGAVGDGPSRGIVLAVDETARRATLVREYADGTTYGQYMGNVQVLPDGNAVVGWGSTPKLTEFAADGTPVLEITGLGDGSYRSYRSPGRDGPRRVRPWWRGRSTPGGCGCTRAGTVRRRWRRGASSPARPGSPRPRS